MQKPVFVLFVDLSAAFDHIIRPWLFQSIYKRLPAEEDTTIIKLLEALYSYTTTALTETPDDTFELTLGVRQGGPESPLLYNLYMDFVMRIFLEECKVHDVKFLKLQYRVRSTATTREERKNNTDHGEVTVDWTGYADDLELLFFEMQESLQICIDITTQNLFQISPTDKYIKDQNHDHQFQMSQVSNGIS